MIKTKMKTKMKTTPPLLTLSQKARERERKRERERRYPAVGHRQLTFQELGSEWERVSWAVKVRRTHSQVLGSIQAARNRPVTMQDRATVKGKGLLDPAKNNKVSRAECCGKISADDPQLRLWRKKCWML